MFFGWDYLGGWSGGVCGWSYGDWIVGLCVDVVDGVWFFGVVVLDWRDLVWDGVDFCIVGWVFGVVDDWVMCVDLICMVWLIVVEWGMVVFWFLFVWDGS